MSFLFDLIYLLPALVYAPVFFVKSRRADENPGLLFSERWGSYAPEKLARLSGKRIFWVHAVSVGEVSVARRFIDSLRSESKDFHFVLTTVTPTGQKLARQAEAADLTAFYVPFDFSFCVDAFLRAIKPEVLVLVETEIWPNLILRTAVKNIPIFLINARLSERSLRGYRRVAGLFAPVYAKIAKVFAQSDADEKRFQMLGIPAVKTENAGNIKYDIEQPNEAGASFRREYFGITKQDPVWIAGSTHPGEEKQVIEIFNRLRTEHVNLRLIVAPRHVERTAAVLKDCSLPGLTVKTWSAYRSAEAWDVLVIDQLGILKNIYAAGDFVFMGGSWIPHGGQNPIEPAVFDLPVLHGPHVFNFKQVYEMLDEAGASFCVADTESCFEKVKFFLSLPEEAMRAGKKAGEAICQGRGASLRQAQAICNVLKERKHVL